MSWLYIPCDTTNRHNMTKLTKLLRKLGYHWVFYESKEFSISKILRQSRDRSGTEQYCWLLLNTYEKVVRYNEHSDYSSALEESDEEFRENRTIHPFLESIISMANGDNLIAFNLFWPHAERIIKEAQDGLVLDSI